MNTYYDAIALAAGVTREQAKRVLIAASYVPADRATRDKVLTYFIAGRLPGGGSHAGEERTKTFSSVETRRQFYRRMADIYGECFYCKGDDPSEQRFMHRVEGAWQL